MISSGVHSYTSYNLSHISTVALTSYGGPDASFTSPGFTISNRISDQNSALNALIMDFNPRKKANLAASYRYVESEGRIITTEHFARINARPSIKADLSAASCTANSIKLPLFLNYKNEEEDVPTFHVYTILRKAEIVTLKALIGKYILGPNGVAEWKNQKTFDILDPCNQQFLTLGTDSDGNFLVNIPPFQTLATSDIICVAINDVAHSQYDLVLYEIKLGTSSWSASDRFVGLISKDYIEDLTLRIATRSDRTLIPSSLKVKVEFHSDTDAHLTIITSKATTCQVYLSPMCTYDIFTTAAMLYAEKPLQNCGKLFEKAGYNCQGVMGYFYPPPAFVKTPISHFSENTTFLKAHNEDFSAAQASADHQNLISILINYFKGWTRQNTPTKLLPIIALLLFVVFLVRLKKNQRSQYKGIDRKNSEDDFE